MLKTAALATALIASLAVAAPALAKPVSYSGTTSGGDRITFKRSGNAVKDVSTMVFTTCVAAGPAAPRSGKEYYVPPGRLPLGRELSGSVLQDAAMHYGEVTKNHRFKARRRANGTISGRLHVNFSFRTIGYGYYIQLVGYVCQGDATFTAKPVRRR